MERMRVWKFENRILIDNYSQKQFFEETKSSIEDWNEIKKRIDFKEKRYEIRSEEDIIYVFSNGLDRQDIIDLINNLPDNNKKLLEKTNNTPILDRILEEFHKHIRNEVYSMCQFKLAARSNKIEGNTLTEEDTATLFDTQQIPSSDYKAKDIEEAQGHFLMFNEMLKTVDQELNINMIRNFHKQLTQSIFEFKANGGIPGEFKTRKNIAGTSETSSPENAQQDLYNLLNWYNKAEKNIFNIAKLHACYEHIHPFQDYNGRTGRMLVFRESLLLNTPIIVNPAEKSQYISILKNCHDCNESDESIKPLAELFEKWIKEFKVELDKLI